MKRKRSEILNKLADAIMELDDVREQLKQARDCLLYTSDLTQRRELRAVVHGNGLEYL